MKSVLLDTAVFLLGAAQPERLTARAKESHASAETAFLSIASVWEIAIKVGVGKLEFPLHEIEREIAAQQLSILGISIDHAQRTGALPPHHKDPFDRMLAAQAMAEGTPIISPDRIFVEYGVPAIW